LEEWVERALAKWPNVPALFGWLTLDRRGRWLIRGEIISRPQIIETIGRNYAADEHGRWFFQNGPQRGYMVLEYAPWVLRVSEDLQTLETHTSMPAGWIERAILDEHGSLLLQTQRGPGLLADNELDWAMQRLRAGGGLIDEEALAEALALPGGSWTALTLELDGRSIGVERIDEADIAGRLGFVRDPQPLDGERVSRNEAAVD
jgi:hypothetical protein